jgi:hypothetical protein
VQLYQQCQENYLPTLVIPVGRLNPEGIEVRDVQRFQQPRKLLPTLVIQLAS